MDDLPDAVLVISIDEQLRANTTAATLWLTTKLQVFEETIVDKLRLNLSTAVQSSTVLTPADALSSDTPLSGSYTAGAQSLDEHKFTITEFCMVIVYTLAEYGGNTYIIIELSLSTMIVAAHMRLYEMNMALS